MAGSYEHVKHGWSLIENMGDAYEAVEELFYLVRCFADEQDVREALAAFYAYENGEMDPRKLSEPSAESEAMPTMSDYGLAYLDAKDALSR
jgi:hypothetical protein